MMTQDPKDMEFGSASAVTPGQKVFVVLGSPRSGTSLTAGLLEALGVDMGDVRPPDSQNPTGYYEDRAFLALGKTIFQAADPDASGFDLPDMAAILNRREMFEGRIKAAVLDRVNHSKGSIWGWKTIHSNLTLPLFMPYLNDPHLIVVFRNPLSIAKSVIRFTATKSHLYAPMDLRGALNVVHLYYKHINDIIASYHVPTFFIAYEDLTGNPAFELTRLIEFLGIEPSEGRRARALRMVASKRGLRRARYQLLFVNSASRLRNLPKKLLPRMRK